jgi:hypothetical protein
MADMIAATEGAPLLNKAEEKLIAWDDLPDWSKDNEYIHTGYRPISNSYWQCLQSCFYRHNETVNIYTHLLATFWMIALPIALYPHARDHYPTAGADDWTVFALFFLGGASCFALSTIYHVLSNHSHAVHDFAHKLDFLGITIVTTGCFPPGVWYTFPCAARKTKIFWISVRRGSPPGPRQLLEAAGKSDNRPSARPRRPIPSCNIRLFRPTLPAAGMPPSAWRLVFVHGIVRLLPDHLRLRPAWVYSDGS